LKYARQYNHGLWNFLFYYLEEALGLEMESVSIIVKPARVFALAMSIIIISSTLAFSITDIAQGGKYGDIIPTTYETTLLEKINENRTQNGVGALKLNATLTWVARAHSQDMIDYDFFDHTSSSQGQFNGATFQERVTTYAEYENSYIGECIAWKSWGIDVESTMSSWKNSASHWDIIINPNFHEIGIGLVEGEWDGYPNAGLHTVDFGGHATSVDLSISGIDIGFEPVSPYEGDIVKISANIKNKGSTDAYPVIAKFYDGSPQSGGVQIGTCHVPQVLIHGEQVQVSIYWDTTGKAGDHSIYVVVDPDDIISENDEGNNLASKSLTIRTPNSPIALNYGWNLVSFPYMVTDTDIENVLNSINGKYDRVQVYDSSESPSKWLDYNVFKPSNMNKLKSLDNEVGFWIHVTEESGADLIVEGDSPLSSQQINLKSGWNLVGYPCTTGRERDNALNNLEYGIDVEVIQRYDAISNTYKNLGEEEAMKPGQGYFIFANYDCQWIVNP
jgi:uncharacterized protein YkwD